MKRQILIGLTSLAMMSVALGRTASSYVNNVVLIAPSPTLLALPTVDATNFINNSAFIDNSLSLLTTTTLLVVEPYETANTLNYTNYGVLGSLAGFQLDYFNTHLAQHFMAGTIDNEVGAVINCGGTNDGPYFTTNSIFFFGAISGGGALCVASATNIINRGTIEMGPDSLLSLHGQNVSLAGGLLNMEGFETGTGFGTIGVGGSGSFVLNSLGSIGMFDGYWGLGQTPNYNPAAAFNGFPDSPPYWVTNRYYSAEKLQSALPLATTYVNTITNAISVTTDGTNSTFGIDTTFQVIFLQTADDQNITHNAYFPGLNVVEWRWPSTNIITGLAQTNHLYLEDDLIDITNLVLLTNQVAPPNTGYGWTFIPTNLFLFQSSLPLGLPASPTLAVGLFGPDTNNFSSPFSAYEAIFEPLSVIPGELAGQTFTNMPGRIEVTADKQLDLRSSRISGLNYLRLTATNNFTQDRNTRILTAVADYNLGVTNATMTVSNLLAPTCPRLNGFVDVWSTAWTNIPPGVTNFSGISTNVYNYTNRYFITLVDSSLASSAPSLVQNLGLHANTVVISDVLTVISNITIDAYNLLITTNGPGSQTPVGELNMPSGLTLGPSNLPRLQTLTNYGIISVQSTATFGSPNQPYSDFVNRGSVLVQGCSISTANFESTGRIDSGPGPIDLSAGSAVINHGVLNAPFSDIVFDVGNLSISNETLNAGHSITIRAANSLSDGGPASGNIWMAGILGFNLPIKPPVGDLLGTTITDAAPAWAQVASQWAGEDRGPVVAGYSNNAALGRLILDGGSPGSSFIFNAPAGANALYVDYLEFRNNLTNFDSSGNLANLYFGPGMKIYYAQLIINGISLAEKLDQANGGGLNWVPAYAGAFSSTNIYYPSSGTTNRINAALAQSCDLDSNGNGIPNCLDLEPVFVPAQVGLAAGFTNAPQPAVVLSWNSVPYATNSVFFKPSLTAANWQLLTTFVLGPTGGRQRFVDPVTAGGRFYQVQVDRPLP